MPRRLLGTFSIGLVLSGGFLSSGFMFPGGAAFGHELKDFSGRVEEAEKLSRDGKNKEAMQVLIDAYKDLKGISHARDKHQAEFERVSQKLADSYKKAGDWTAEYRTLVVLAAFYRYHKRTDTIEYADCLWQIGQNCDHRKHYDEALANIKQAAEIYKVHPSITPERESRIDRGLGHLYLQSGQNRLAEHKLAEAVKVSDLLVKERVHDLGRALILQGKNYFILKEYEKAFDAYREAVEVFEDSLNRGHMLTAHALDSYVAFIESLPADVLADTTSGVDASVRKEHLVRTLADAYMLNSRFYKAKTYLLKLKDLYEKSGKTEKMVYGRCLEELGECCLRLKDYTEGLVYQAEATRLYKDVLNDRDSAAMALLGLAAYQYQNEDAETAKKTLVESQRHILAIHGAQSWQYGESLLLELKWLFKEEKKTGLKPLLEKLALVYSDEEISSDETDDKKLRLLILKLSRIKSERFHDYLWHDWEKLDKSKLF